MKDIAFIASVIHKLAFNMLYAGPQYPTVQEVHHIIAEMAVKCHDAFTNFPPEHDCYDREEIIEWAKNELVEKYNFKL